jgi:imidazolonepropionase-like amidohydrolase
MPSLLLRFAGPCVATMLFLVGCSGNERTANVDWPSDPVGPLLIREVAVIDVETGRRLLRRDVIVREGRIHAIEPTTARPPAGIRVIDGRGASLLPGLIDMHGHVMFPRGPLWSTDSSYSSGNPEANLRSYLYAGVTTLLDPADSTGEAVERRERVRSQKLVGPRIFTSGKPITGRGGHPVAMIELLAPRWLASFIGARMATQVESKDESHLAVDSLARAGVDVVKVYVNQIPPESPRISTALLDAIADRARDHDLRWVAGIGTTQDALDTGRAGTSLWMHGIAKERIPDDQIETLAAFGIPMVATIEAPDRIIRSLDGPIDPIPMERETVPLEVLESFYPPPEGFSLGRFGFGSLEDADSPGVAGDNVMRLRNAGVTILAGSDPLRGGIFPGASLHRELGQLVRAGLTPAEAIRAATLDSATYLANGEPIEFGAVRVGLRADLLLVEGDPTVDISRLQMIREVILSGIPMVRSPVAP